MFHHGLSWHQTHPALHCLDQPFNLLSSIVHDDDAVYDDVDDDDDVHDDDDETEDDDGTELTLPCTIWTTLSNFCILFIVSLGPKMNKKGPGGPGQRWEPKIDQRV